jgi:hypothetical protein
MHIYHSRWHELSSEHIINLFNKYLGGVTALPFPLLSELDKLEKATLEVIEDRYDCTVYLIRETGAIYQIMKRGVMYGPFWGWVNGLAEDQVKAVYKSKPCVFIISDPENSHLIQRLKSPKFLAHYDPKTKDIFDVEWIDEEPFQTTSISVLKKAKFFLQKSVK